MNNNSPALVCVLSAVGLALVGCAPATRTPGLEALADHITVSVTLQDESDVKTGDALDETLGDQQPEALDQYRELLHRMTGARLPARIARECSLDIEPNGRSHADTTGEIVAEYSLTGHIQYFGQPHYGVDAESGVSIIICCADDRKTAEVLEALITCGANRQR